jgi:hypothetical protein
LVALGVAKSRFIGTFDDPPLEAGAATRCSTARPRRSSIYRWKTPLRPGDEPRQRVERPHDHSLAHRRLGRVPLPGTFSVMATCEARPQRRGCA